MTTTTYLSPRSSTVMVDRAWAQSLGLNQVAGARRVGNFYRLPRVAYLRALQAMSDQSGSSQAFGVPSVQVSVDPAMDVSSRRSLAPCADAAAVAAAKLRRQNAEIVAA